MTDRNIPAETMNIDIVSRLRMFSPFESPLMHECADMIERLRTDRLQAQHERDCAVEDVARLHDALKQVADVMEKDGRFPTTVRAIRATLTRTEEQHG